MILVFGQTGQVSSELAKLDNIQCMGRNLVNLEDPKSCAAMIKNKQPLAVINAAAYTGVDNAETEEPLARVINAESPFHMASACRELNIPFVHISTDYVFDGSGKTPWTNEDKINPLGVYGRTKQEGEQAIVEVNPNAIILRTSWVFSTTGDNFVTKMLRLSETQTKLLIVSDQVGGPTSAHSISRACYFIVSELLNHGVGLARKGIYHYSGYPDVSWATFARKIFFEAGVKMNVQEILTCQHPTLGKRPLNSRLNCNDLKNHFNISRPNWKLDLKYIISELRG